MYISSDWIQLMGVFFRQLLTENSARTYECITKNLILNLYKTLYSYDFYAVRHSFAFFRHTESENDDGFDLK